MPGKFDTGTLSCNKVIFRIFLATLFAVVPFTAMAQSTNYWTRSFNEESSLLAGAVVGGGSTQTAIYYNPACISEVQAAKLSLNASLFSFDIISIRNALGNDININWFCLHQIKISTYEYKVCISNCISIFWFDSKITGKIISET